MMTIRTMLLRTVRAQPVRCVANRRPLTTMERSIGDKIGTDDAAFAQSGFDGSVYPDLPVVGAEMSNAIEETIRRRVQEDVPSGKGSIVVRTVAAQCLDGEQITRKIDIAGNLFRGSKSVKGALLCVSGGDKGRGVRETHVSAFKDSRFILEQATIMKASGDIPNEVDLWAVANPMTDSVDSFKRKVDAGARCFLTQPPFFQRASRAWFEQVAETEHSRDVDMLVGVPLITSMKNLDFWLALCGMPTVGEEATALKREFPHDSASYKVDSLIEWNARFMRDIALKMPGVTGMHVMPITANGLSMMGQVMSRTTEP